MEERDSSRAGSPVSTTGLLLPINPDDALADSLHPYPPQGTHKTMVCFVMFFAASGELLPLMIQIESAYTGVVVALVVFSKVVQGAYMPRLDDRHGSPIYCPPGTLLTRSLARPFHRVEVSWVVVRFIQVIASIGLYLGTVLLPVIFYGAMARLEAKPKLPAETVNAFWPVLGICGLMQLFATLRYHTQSPMEGLANDFLRFFVVLTEKFPRRPARLTAMLLALSARITLAGVCFYFYWGRAVPLLLSHGKVMDVRCLSPQKQAAFAPLAIIFTIMMAFAFMLTGARSVVQRFVSSPGYQDCSNWDVHWGVLAVALVNCGLYGFGLWRMTLSVLAPAPFDAGCFPLEHDYSRPLSEDANALGFVMMALLTVELWRYYESNWSPRHFSPRLVSSSASCTPRSSFGLWPDESPASETLPQVSNGDDKSLTY